MNFEMTLNNSNNTININYNRSNILQKNTHFMTHLYFGSSLYTPITVMYKKMKLNRLFIYFFTYIYDHINEKNKHKR